MDYPAAPHREGLTAGAWLAAIIESSDDAIVSKTLDGTITSWNSAAERMFGFSALEAIGQSITIIIPEDRLPEESKILASIRAGRRIEHFETVRRRQDGSLFAVSVTVSPVRDEAGVIQGASKILRDITDRREAEERQSLLLREMNHRAKNLFAVIAGLVTVTSRSAGSKEELVTTLTGRISALARAHALTLPDPDSTVAAQTSTTLTSLLHAILEPYPGQCTIELDGEDAPIGGSALSSLALMLHEFAINSAKYGALSSENGCLTVQVSSVGRILRLIWTESLGPASPPEHVEGFGAKLEQASLRSLNGTLERQWKSEGLVIVLTIPIARMA